MAVCFPITKQKEPIIIRFISCDYRLCVNASGSVITEIFKFFTLIRFSCLHFGQYRGKFFISVSSRILNRVLLLHTGHKIHLHLDFISFSPYIIFILLSAYSTSSFCKTLYFFKKSINFFFHSTPQSNSLYNSSSKKHF